ncbi:MAG: hypothetical protein Q8R28_15020 [Dehalococcoidia bacterium]|nr:hypothetical protein [Dehalococcoidia bacterium]
MKCHLCNLPFVQFSEALDTCPHCGLPTCQQCRNGRWCARCAPFAGWQPLEPAVLIMPTVGRLMAEYFLSRAEAEAQLARLAEDKVYMNNLYQVNVSEHEGMVHLSIKRRDKEPIHDWRDLQQIKNELVGPENEGFELYPAESRVVDLANQYHLWVLKDPTARMPYGFHEGRRVSDVKFPNTKQRPRTEVGNV